MTRQKIPLSGGATLPDDFPFEINAFDLASEIRFFFLSIVILYFPQDSRITEAPNHRTREHHHETTGPPQDHRTTAMAGHGRTTGMAGHGRAWPDHRTTGHGNTTTRSPDHQTRQITGPPRDHRTTGMARNGRTTGMAGHGGAWPDRGRSPNHHLAGHGRTSGPLGNQTWELAQEHWITTSPAHPSTRQPPPRDMAGPLYVFLCT